MYCQGGGYKMTTFLTSDEHYFHENMIGFCDRPYSSETHMRRSLIENHNEVVGTNDTVFHIGDFAMLRTSQHEKLGNVIKKLNGRHHLILGNHDYCKPMIYVNAGFISVHTALWVEEFVLAHDPSVYCACRNKLGILAHGHVHTLYHTIKEKSAINVGVDMNNYYPISLDEARTLLDKEVSFYGDIEIGC